MKEIKEYSGKWLSTNPNFPDIDGWAVSFSGFTYNYKEKQLIIYSMKNQKEHHKKLSFEEEYRKFLIENGIDIDERYFLKERFCPAFQAVVI
jgi:hypothetical protein